MYKLGNISQFNIDDSDAKQAAGWTQDEIDNGKIVQGDEGDATITNVLCKNQNPKDSDQFIWEIESGDIDENGKYNIMSVWKRSIIRPLFDKYYIAHNGGIAQGIAKAGLSTVFGSGIEYIEIFDIESDYLARIEELGIIIIDDTPT